MSAGEVQGFLCALVHICLELWSVSAKTSIFPTCTQVHFSRGRGSRSKNRKYRQTPGFKARLSVESDLMSIFWFLIYFRKTWKVGLVFPAKTNRTILKKSTAIDSSQKSPDLVFFRISITTKLKESWAKNRMPFCLVFPAITNRTNLKTTTAIDSPQKSPDLVFFRFSIKTQVAEIFDILSKTKIFPQSLTKKLVHKLLEISVGCQICFQNIFCSPCCGDHYGPDIRKNVTARVTFFSYHSLFFQDKIAQIKPDNPTP